MREYAVFTSESVSEGHPDKMADQISDAILDAILEQDIYARVACETLVKTGAVVLAGEITTTANIDFENIVGTIAGDDTIFVLCRNLKATEEMLNKFRKLI